MTLLITGGCGFIGTNFIKNWLQHYNEEIVNFDNLSYPCNYKYSKNFAHIRSYTFVKGNILDENFFNEIVYKFSPRAVINFAAQTHVDRSIENPDNFISSNILGTYNVIKILNKYIKSKNLVDSFKFIQVSTDEVFGSLTKNDKPFHENSSYNPNNPYAASKASADQLVRSFNKTYNFPSIIINCSNNYGPFQNQEKFIPKIIYNAINNIDIPIYGNGENIRDWIHVEDNCKAILKILEKGEIGERYNIGARNEISNNELLNIVLNFIYEEYPPFKNLDLKKLVKKGEIRLGHDFRYSINPTKLEKKIGWQTDKTFKSALKETVKWYIQEFSRK